MSQQRRPQDQDKFIVRLPDGMRDKLKKVATTAGRSLNAEITRRLEWSLANEEAFAEYEVRTTATSKLAAERILAMGTPMEGVQDQIDELRARIVALEKG